MLSSLQEVRELGDQLGQKEAQLHDVERQLATLKATAEKYARVGFIHSFMGCCFKHNLSGFPSGDNSTDPPPPLGGCVGGIPFLSKEQEKLKL